MSAFTKPIPKSILIFGASSHIGRPLTTYLLNASPTTKLRLVTSNPDKLTSLKSSFPSAEVISANYDNPESLSLAVADMQAVFVVTPGGFIEKPGMTNLVASLRQASTVTHVVRLLGIFPELPPHRVPSTLPPGSLPVEHPIAKKILDESGLPVTYLNCGATFMDNLLLQIKSAHATGTLIWPEHRVPFIDPRDVALVAGHILLSPNAKHIGAFHTLNNNQDRITFSELAEILSEVLGRKIGHDGSWETFSDFYTPVMGPKLVKKMWDFFKFEEANEETWALNEFVERTLGRRPTSVREWILEHKEALESGAGTAAWAFRDQ
ncbi:hypothetical protein CSOJ01_13226 [Colletotrichum sojae]|uniref:NAD(P)-binding domain-containing protein n=1 Tax=Colletotrichum sojae TaxID=2175907 RepID=A0A8H6MKU2_9PEZI|nr:hypothetical protein CSOJ01_13226 [Colletotrichum sojae]